MPPFMMVIPVIVMAGFIVTPPGMDRLRVLI